MSEKRKLIALKIARLLIKCAMAIMDVVEPVVTATDKSCLEVEVPPSTAK